MAKSRIKPCKTKRFKHVKPKGSFWTIWNPYMYFLKSQSSDTQREPHFGLHLASSSLALSLLSYRDQKLHNDVPTPCEPRISSSQTLPCSLVVSCVSSGLTLLLTMAALPSSLGIHRDTHTLFRPSLHFLQVPEQCSRLLQSSATLSLVELKIGCPKSSWKQCSGPAMLRPLLCKSRQPQPFLLLSAN